MLEPFERSAILRMIRADRPNNRETFRTAVLYAAQVLVASVLLLEGYSWYGSPGAIWAVVSAALVIQPALEQAISASAVRIAANIVGGIVGILVGHFWGESMWHFLFAVVIVVAICDLLKLDLGLRTAVVSVAVIMLKSDGKVLSTAQGRLVAVVIGCLTGLCVQLAAEAVRKRIGWTELNAGDHSAEYSAKS
jgi:uncharacterized membrane protein YgaE (UPF0421/DUF939 family)